jgi:hypothetical protein
MLISNCTGGEPNSRGSISTVIDVFKCHFLYKCTTNNILICIFRIQNECSLEI